MKVLCPGHSREMHSSGPVFAACSGPAEKNICAQSILLTAVTFLRILPNCQYDDSLICIGKSGFCYELVLWCICSSPKRIEANQTFHPIPQLKQIPERTLSCGAGWSAFLSPPKAGEAGCRLFTINFNSFVKSQKPVLANQVEQSLRASRGLEF